MRRGEPIDVAAEMNAPDAHDRRRDALRPRPLGRGRRRPGACARVAPRGDGAPRDVTCVVAAHLAAPTATQPRAFRGAGARRSTTLVYDDDRRPAPQRAQRARATTSSACSMAARDEETGRGHEPARQLRDEVDDVPRSPGHETTAVALAWTWYLLARHPEIAERRATRCVRVLGDRARRRSHDLPQLPLARMVVEEAMRLYPPVWGIGRQAIAADGSAAAVSPAGAIVNSSRRGSRTAIRAFWDGSRPLRSRALPPGARAHATALRLLPLQRRPAPLHRRDVRAGRGAAHRGHDVSQRHQLRGSTMPGSSPEPTPPLRPRGGLRMRVTRCPARPAPLPAESGSGGQTPTLAFLDVETKSRVGSERSGFSPSLSCE